MAVTSPFKNIQALAQDLKNAAQNQSNKMLTARPWNRFTPANSIWYLLPDSTWPAYHQSKLVLRPMGDIFCGLYVEKGLGRTLDTVYPQFRKRGFIMDGTWYWHTFQKAISSPAFLNTAQAVGAQYGAPVRVIVEGTTANGLDQVKGEDPGQTLDDDEIRRQLSVGRIDFEIQPSGKLKFISQQNVREQLERALSCTSMTELSKSLSHPQVKEWIWIDLNIGVFLKRTDEPVPGCWSTEQIWQMLLAPWLPWVK